MSTKLKIIVAQLNFLVGDIEGNLKKIVQATKEARDKVKASLIVFPELALCGYLPEDLLFRPDFHIRIKNALTQLCQEVIGIDVLVGYPEQINGKLYNAAAWIRDRQVIANYHKHCLPNYGVFDEKRYFVTDKLPCIVNLKNIPVAISICEDIWYAEPFTVAKTAGAELMICINASPYDSRKIHARLEILQQRAIETQLPIIYAQSIGGQDELVFDGGSMVVDAAGKLCQQATFFAEDQLAITIQQVNNKISITSLQARITQLTEEESVYKALVLGTRDYIEKNHFKGALVGLSGGIDSALTLAIAADAIGPERVTAVLMPSCYTAAMSNEDAIAEANALGVHYLTLPIEFSFNAFLTTLAEAFAGSSVDTTEENIQARCRGVLLMALSNKTGKLVLTTGNKSEMAVGYATLYGDMAGGFAVLKDVYKTLVYRLAHYRNSISMVIPQRVLERAPSAELAPNQKDEDSLPPYPQLDAILERYIEQNQSIEEVVAGGFAEDTVRKIVAMIYRNEYKRRQAAPGIKITSRAFGRDRRYPITSGFKG